MARLWTTGQYLPPSIATGQATCRSSEPARWRRFAERSAAVMWLGPIAISVAHRDDCESPEQFLGSHRGLRSRHPVALRPPSESAAFLLQVSQLLAVFRAAPHVGVDQTRQYPDPVHFLANELLFGIHGGHGVLAGMLPRHPAGALHFDAVILEPPDLRIKSANSIDQIG